VLTPNFVTEALGGEGMVATVGGGSAVAVGAIVAGGWAVQEAMSNPATSVEASR
jgi:hypothetical protein